MGCKILAVSFPFCDFNYVVFCVWIVSAVSFMKSICSYDMVFKVSKYECKILLFCVLKVITIGNNQVSVLHSTDTFGSFLCENPHCLTPSESQKCSIFLHQSPSYVSTICVPCSAAGANNIACHTSPMACWCSIHACETS